MRALALIALSSLASGCCFGGAEAPVVPAVAPVAVPAAPAAPAWPPAGVVSCMANNSAGGHSFCWDLQTQYFSSEAEAIAGCGPTPGGGLIYGACPIDGMVVGACIDPDTGVMTNYYAPEWDVARAQSMCAMHRPPGMFVGGR